MDGIPIGGTLVRRKWRVVVPDFRVYRGIGEKALTKYDYVVPIEEVRRMDEELRLKREREMMRGE